MSEHERPKRIWLLHDTGDGGGDTWCQDRNPTTEPDEDMPATEYIRADVARQREARLRNAAARIADICGPVNGRLEVDFIPVPLSQMRLLYCVLKDTEASDE